MTKDLPAPDLGGSPINIPLGRFSRFRRAIRPLRRLAAWFALVHEEHDLRRGDVDSLRRDVARLLGVADKLEGWRQEIEATEQAVRERANGLVAEVWRRAELADANQATEIQRLAQSVARILRENAAVFTLFEEARVRASADQQLSGMDPATSETTVARMPTRSGLFRELERGSRDEIMDRVKLHAVRFTGPKPVLDIGCGRGEFLDVCAARGVPAYGVDIDPEVIEVCRGLGFDARLEDAFEHLDQLKPESLSGVFTAHVVEHLSPSVLPELFEKIARALEAGGVVVVETPNPASFYSHVQSFWRDPEHIRPVPPDSLAFAARLAGLVVQETMFLAPPNDQLSLLRHTEADESLSPLIEQLNSRIEQLNDLLYGPQDYALIANKP